MSRLDAAPILESLGFVSLVDFEARLNTPPTSVTITWKSAQPQPSDATLNAIAWSPAIAADALSQRERPKASAAIASDPAALWKAIRAAAAVLVDEVNDPRQWIMSFKAAVAASTSLADLKTRVAGLPDLPDRTLAQAKTAIQNKITAGTVD